MRCNKGVLGAPASRRQEGSYNRELCFSHIRHLAVEPEGCGWIYLAAAGTAALPASQFCCGFESLLHEDNRYFVSREKGFWPRFGYSLSSGILARHDNGKRYPSASLLIGYAGGAYVSRFWQPASANSVGDAAVSFGISMGWNIGLGAVKEFLPGILHR